MDIDDGRLRDTLFTWFPDRLREVYDLAAGWKPRDDSRGDSGSPHDQDCAALESVTNPAELLECCEELRQRLAPNSKLRDITTISGPVLLRLMWAAMRRMRGGVPTQPDFVRQFRGNDPAPEVIMAFLKEENQTLINPEDVLSAIDKVVSWCVERGGSNADHNQAGLGQAEEDNADRADEEQDPTTLPMIPIASDVPDLGKADLGKADPIPEFWEWCNRLRNGLRQFRVRLGEPAPGLVAPDEFRVIPEIVRQCRGYLVGFGARDIPE